MQSEPGFDAFNKIPELCQVRNPCTGEPALEGPVCSATGLMENSNSIWVTISPFSASERWGMTPTLFYQLKIFRSLGTQFLCFCTSWTAVCRTPRNRKKIPWKRKNALPRKTILVKPMSLDSRLSFQATRNQKPKSYFCRCSVLQHSWGQKITFSCTTWNIFYSAQKGSNKINLIV